MDIIASSGAPVVDTPFHLQFDPGVLAYVDASPGEFLAQAGSSVVFLADGQSRPGDIAIGIGRVDRTAGATGVGLLCRIHLRGLALGGTTVSFGQALAWDASDRSVAVVTLGSSVVVLGQSSPAR